MIGFEHPHVGPAPRHDHVEHRALQQARIHGDHPPGQRHLAQQRQGRRQFPAPRLVVLA
jgi:hypothetical protein